MRISRPLRALCFFLARYRILNKYFGSPSYKGGQARLRVPPYYEHQRRLSQSFFQLTPRAVVMVLPQSVFLGPCGGQALLLIMASRLMAAGRAATLLLVGGLLGLFGSPPQPPPPECVLGLAWLCRGGGLQKERGLCLDGRFFRNKSPSNQHES